MIDEMMDYVKKTYPMIRWKMIETENLFFEESKDKLLLLR